MPLLSLFLFSFLLGERDRDVTRELTRCLCSVLLRETQPVRESRPRQGPRGTLVPRGRRAPPAPWVGGDPGLEAVVLPGGPAVGPVAVRGGEAEEGGAGDVCASEGAGERVGHGEGEGVGVWAGAVWRRAVDGDRDGYGYGTCFSASYASDGRVSLTHDDVAPCAEHVPGESLHAVCWCVHVAECFLMPTE